MSYPSFPGGLPHDPATRQSEFPVEPAGIPRTQVSLVRVLGPLVLDLGGDEVRLKRRKPRETFLLLLLHRGARLRMEFIVDALWESSLPEHTRPAVRSYLSSIRRWIAAWPPGVGGPVLCSEAGAYQLDLEDSHLDLAQFTRLAARGQLALREGLPAAALQDLDEALGLFRGAALQDAAGCTFAVPEITRLEEMRLEAREARALALLELGLSGSAIADLSDLANEAPYRVRPAALLMVSLYRASRQVEALNCAQIFRRALWAELGERPEPSFLALERAILNQDTELDGAALIRTIVLRGTTGTTLVSAPSRPVPGDRAFTAGRKQAESRPLLGRAEAEDRLVSMLQWNTDVSIVGPVGCGKSALAARVADRFRDEGNIRVARVDVSASPDADTLTGRIGRLADDVASRRPGGRLLLVIDNCDASPEMVNSVAAELHGRRLQPFRVLRTSRRRDHPGSTLYSLDPLPSPPAAGSGREELLASAAVALFCQRAAATRRGFETSSEHILAVARICEAVDCLPLAIEIAAAQTLAVNPAELEALLAGDLFSVLEPPHGSGWPHPSLHAAFRRTYEQLTRAEQKALRRFSDMDRTFSLEEVISEAGPADVVPALDGLVTQSIVFPCHSAGLVRYRMLRTWRAFARTSAWHELVAAR
jgi:DNA-binding SARP family transcriptional activator/predicted ATPase